MARREQAGLAEKGSRSRFVRDLVEPLRIAPGRAVQLKRDFDPGDTEGLSDKAEAQALLAEGITALADYQSRLWAQKGDAVLVLVQGIDAAGKDSVVKQVMSGVNPQGVEVRSFKQPSAEELNHDYLWRYQRDLPELGRIGIFNRSHYEEVLVVRVHPELLAARGLPAKSVKGDLWKRRYREINGWEQYLVDNGVRIVKIFLNLSKAEQAKRFLRRIDRPDKNWKFAADDIRERRYWDDYQRAFDQMLSHTSTSWAPWYVVPADNKWFARLATAAILVHTLAELDPQYPKVAPEVREEMAKARAELVSEVP